MGAIKLLFILLGTLSLALGIAGIFVPGLPATPFILLTAGLYSRSSDRLYKKLISNKQIARIIHDFTTNGGIGLKVKLTSILFMWLMIGISCLFFTKGTELRMILVVLGLIGTIVMGFLIKSR